MSDFDWKSIVRTVAPGIATALGGPLAGIAVSAIGNALGIDEPTQEKVIAAVKGATPDDLLKLKQAEQEFILQMKKLEIDVAKIAADDRDSARKREMATGDWTPKILAFVIVVTWGAVQYYLLRNVVHEDMRELVMRVLGTLDAALMLVLSYYYGASATGGTTVINGERRR
jgi:hypothetical protein